LAEVKILGLSGSNGRGSFNVALLRNAQELLPPGARMEIFDISGLPLFGKDREREPPPVVMEFKRKVREADALLFASPEFNFSVTAAMKNAIEWGNRPEEDNSWDGKPAAIVSASTATRGGARAQLHLRSIMADLNVHPVNRPQLYVGRAQEAFDREGRLTDERHRRTLEALLRALVEWTLTLRKEELPA
jgi:chromate reductase, NAD(P)H dehydrogenase (quinone)